MFGFGTLLNDENNKPVGAVFGECQHSKNGFSQNVQLTYQCINVSLRADGTRSWLVFHLTNLITSEANEYLSSISETAGIMTIIPLKLKHMQAFVLIFQDKQKHTSLYVAHFLFPFAWEHLLSSLFSWGFFCLFVLGCFVFFLPQLHFCTSFPFSLFQDFKSHCLVIYVKADCENIRNHPPF